MPLDLINPRPVRTLTDPESERLRKQYPDLPSSPAQCVTCRGTKKFLWWDDPTSAERETVYYICNCTEQWVLHRYLLNAGIGLAYQRLGWADVEAEEGAILKAQNYLDNAEGYVANGLGLILYGTIGTGKTLLGILILKGLLAQGVDCYMTTFSGMIELLSSGWTDNDDKQWFVKRVKNAGVLMVDDVGREHHQRRMVKGQGLTDITTALAESTFEEVIRHRVSAAKPTIVTGNLDLQSLETKYGGNVLSLLSERSTTYRFEGKDFRETARMRLVDEIEAGMTRPAVLQ